MLRKRIIPCLDVKDGRVVKGVNFSGLRSVGDPVEYAARYSSNGADEIAILDISATLEGRKTTLQLIREIASKINIPLTVGGGVRSIEDAYNLLSSGSDKISINSSAISNPELISQLATRFGKQCVVVAIDAKYLNNQWLVHTHSGTRATRLRVLDWAQRAYDLGAGELLVTSMDEDGTRQGYAISLLDEITCSVNIPVIASGGAGTINHFSALFKSTGVDAALAASIFHSGEISIPELKQSLNAEGICVRI